MVSFTEKTLNGKLLFFAVYFKIKHRRRAMGQVWSKLTNNGAKKKTQKYWSKDVLKNGCFGCFQKSFLKKDRWIWELSLMKLLPFGLQF